MGGKVQSEAVTPGGAPLPRQACDPAAPRPVPVHQWDGVFDDEFPALCFVRPGQGAANLRICMSNSFAFGGCNVSLIVGKEA